MRADEIIEHDSQTNPPVSVEGGHYAAPFSVQMSMLWRKYLLAVGERPAKPLALHYFDGRLCIPMQYWRTPSYNFTRYMITILVALLYGAPSC